MACFIVKIAGFVIEISQFHAASGNLCTKVKSFAQEEYFSLLIFSMLNEILNKTFVYTMQPW
jgi:hypothetical protein